MVYIGPAGRGLSWKMAGIDVQEAATGKEAIKLIREIKETEAYQLIFLDEKLALENLNEVEKLNDTALPAIVLLPAPGEAIGAAREALDNLVVKAVGSSLQV